MSNSISKLGYSKNSPYRNNPFNIINSNNITMKNTPIPLLGIDNLGNRKIMKPGNKKNYIFPGNQVMEIPLNYHKMPDGSLMQDNEMDYKKGGMIKRKDGSYSQRGLWDNIRKNKGSGKKPTKEMLDQEDKINKMRMGGKKPCYLCGGMKKKYQAGSFIGPPEYLQELGIFQNDIKPDLYKEIFSGQRQQEQPLNLPLNMLQKENQSLNKPALNTQSSSNVKSPFNFMNPLIGINVGLRGIAENRNRQRQNQYMQQQFANDFNQTYSQADNDYGQSDYRYLGYQMGGSYEPCKDCNEKKSFAKGGTVSKKYEKFLIDKLKSGVSVEELAAQKLGTVEGLSKYASNYIPRTISAPAETNIAIPETRSNYTTSPLIKKQPSSSTLTAAPFYKDVEDKADYQKKLQNWYRNDLKNTDVKSYFAPNRTKIPGVTNDTYTCIDGVCGIMEKNGKKFNAGNVDGRYIGNGTFYENAYVKKLEDVYQTSDDFQIGDIIQARVEGKAVPFDSKVIVDVDDEGNYITYGGTGPSIGAGMKYTKDMLKDMVKNKERIVTRPGYSLDKDKLDIQRASYNDPKIMAALNEKQELKDFETSQQSPYIYSIAEKAKDYNKNTKKVMDKFVKFANDGEAMNNLVNKTGRTKEEINESLLNTFGVLGQENNWGTKGKGIGSKVENIAEKLIKNFGGGKSLSVGQGQIKFKDIPAKIKKQFDIKSTKDLYDIDKVLPLMVALDLDNKSTLETWGKKGVLSKKLFGVDNSDLQLEDIPQNARYSPYLRNQYYPIATEQTKNEDGDYIPFTGQMQYRIDEGSYPSKVKQAWQNNLERKIIRPSILYPDQTIPEEQDYYPRELQPVAVTGIRKKFQSGGKVDNYGYPIPTRNQYMSDPEFYGEAPNRAILNKYSSMVGNGTNQPVPDSQYGKLLNNLSYMKNNIWTESNVYRPENMHIAANYNQINNSQPKNFAKKEELLSFKMEVK